MIDRAIRRLIDRHDLERAETYDVFSEMMEGEASDVQKSAFLVALRMKGETDEEITGAALAMRERVTPLPTDRSDLIDTCGTGGDGHGTFNVSTLAAIVAAGGGATVAKHGNRAVSSACGSADVLAALGVNIELNAAEMVEVLEKAGIAFLFAPQLHPAMRSVAAVRRELGIRTVFNVLGPLTNPAFTRRQVVGVYAASLVETVARVLNALGAEHALVVHSRDGLDEISVSAPTVVSEVRDGSVRTFEITPEQLGVATHLRDAVGGGAAAENAAIARAVLEGAGGAQRDIVAANAGAALYVAGIAATIREGVDRAKDSLSGGHADAALQRLIAASNGFGRQGAASPAS
ncbi:MAG TPA: anthranilate phosphoribosyltransferase [Thermoanaerobaculia bacterium]